MVSEVWIEKYRPQTFAEIKGQEHIVPRIQSFVESENMPHLLFAGPAGVGKTTLSLVIAKTLFGDNWRGNFLELNASDERGIDVVRNKVKDFARTRAIGDVPFKIIYLDECDALTREAQQALRRTMENYVGTCRFILSCNYSSKIIDPIQSRCAVFRFKPLPVDALHEIIEHVSNKEGLVFEDKEAVFQALVDVSNGDVRRLENVLQSCAAVAPSKEGSRIISESLVFMTGGVARPKELGSMLVSASKGDFLSAKEGLFKLMLNYGLSGIDVIKQIQAGVWDLDLSSEQKLALVVACGEAEFRMVEGADAFVQLEALLAQFALKK